MGKGRLEAFSDGVIAIILTIMVLELRAPAAPDLLSLRPLLPAFVAYALSFVFVGIYWNNHHHTLQAVHRVNGAILWANLHLLFWLSFIPFVTMWMGRNHSSSWPVALYGADMLMSGVAYYILTHSLIRHHGKDSALAVAIGGDRKGILSVILYACAIVLAFWRPSAAISLYVLVALIWLVPDRRIERTLES